MEERVRREAKVYEPKRKKPKAGANQTTNAKAKPAPAAAKAKPAPKAKARPTPEAGSQPAGVPPLPADQELVVVGVPVERPVPETSSPV
jgi:hypothetical protein